MDEIETKICSICEKEKRLSEFYPTTLARTKIASKCQCKACAKSKSGDRDKAATRRYYWRNRDKRLEESKWYTMRRNYFPNHTVEEVREIHSSMLKSQQGCCAICGRHGDILYQNLGVDHNHTTGQVRGLLCSECNIGLGKFQVDSCGISLLKKAIEFMENSILDIKEL